MAQTTNANSLLEHIEDGKLFDLEFGETWNSTNDGNSSKYAYHTIKYDFKPASLMKSEQADLTVGSTQDVSIALPNNEGSATQSTKYSGSTKTYTPKECLMIIDPRTGKIVLERLSANVRVKNVRTENRAVNQPVKSTAPRPIINESQPDKKPPKTTTTTAAAATSNKSSTQKVPNSTKPTVNAPVKPMPYKQTSPMDDRLSDEESSPSPSTNVPIIPSNPAPVHTSRRTSHTTLEQDLQLSDTTDEED